MRFSIVFFLLFLLNVSGLIHCNKNQNSKEQKKQINIFILNKLLEGQVNSCVRFSLAEASCIVNPDTPLQTCSQEELTRLKKGIEPETKRTDEILFIFFDCWKKCNDIFNTTEVICTSGTKFQSNKLYREAQKSGTTVQSKNWILCMNSCNKAESSETSSIGATYVNLPY